MITTQKLREFGADVEKGLSRCMNNETLYLRLVTILAKELSDGSLGEALKSGSIDKAFDIAHKLKGAAGNLELTPIYKPVSELTELLRKKEAFDHTELYNDIVKKTHELNELLL